MKDKDRTVNVDVSGIETLIKVLQLVDANAKPLLSIADELHELNKTLKVIASNQERYANISDEVKRMAKASNRNLAEALSKYLSTDNDLIV